MVNVYKMYTILTERYRHTIFKISELYDFGHKYMDRCIVYMRSCEPRVPRTWKPSSNQAALGHHEHHAVASVNKLHSGKNTVV